MSITLIYDVFNDEYNEIEKSQPDNSYTECSISVDEDIHITFADYYLRIRLDSNNLLHAEFMPGWTTGLTEKNIDFTRITNLLEPLIREVLATKNIEQSIRLHKLLFPLLDRKFFTQRVVDNYELPQITPTKSARN
jgi:hypothetical protein